MTKFTKIDELHLQDHYYLNKNDTCFFYGEYTPREGYSYSDTNSFIHNLKKGIEKRENPYEWRHKIRAITRCAEIITNGLPKEWLKEATFIPVPPSKLKTDSLYDDRIVQILKGVLPGENLDIREIIIQTQQRNTMHRSDDRYTPDQLQSMYAIDESLIYPIPRYLAIVDDVLTNGTHFRAISSILSSYFINIPIYGIFIARVARPSLDSIFQNLLDEF